MHGHAGADDDDAFVAEGGDGLSEAEVGVWVLVVVETYLHQGHV